MEFRYVDPEIIYMKQSPSWAADSRSAGQEILLPYMDTEGPSPCSQKLRNEPYPKQAESNPYR